MKQYHSLGQVFLNDRTYIKKIIKTLNFSRKNILEIGPGRGQISEILAKKARNFYCVELDKRLASLLKNKFKTEKNVNIFQTDILKFPISALEKKLIIFGNIPYQISKKIIYYLIENRKFISCAYLTVQREFARKLCAQAKASEFGFLSCYMQYYSEAKIIFNIPAKAFKPIPKVNSSFIELKFYKESPYFFEDEKFLFDLIKCVFGQSRKKIINSLGRCIRPDDFEILKKNLNMDWDRRPKDIALSDYIKIAQVLVLEGPRIKS